MGLRERCRRVLAGALRPLLRRVVRWLDPDDPWERFPHRVPVRRLGQGSTRALRWYFEGETAVRPADLDELCAWLRGCRYASDLELFNEPDFWQHPRTFEHLGKGDCEDHALWAWRKLLELGYEAEFVVGRWDLTRPDPGSHAWVLFRRDGVWHVLESVAKDPAHMVRPLAEARAAYRPHVAVDGAHRTHLYFGQLRTWREQLERTDGEPAHRLATVDA
jgi:hypothetical protein